MSTTGHWQAVYEQKAPDSVSWFQATPTMSHALITASAPARDAAIIDVGGGASTLIDALVASGYRNLTVLDLASAALEHAKTRLGPRATDVRWLAGDVLDLQLPDASIDVWHDRAVFHFLITPQARAQYVAQVRRVLRPGGHVVLATFASDGPTRCSGLEVARYAPQELHAEFGAGFVLDASHREEHVTPSGAVQRFTYCVCRWSPGSPVAVSA